MIRYFVFVHATLFYLLDYGAPTYFFRYVIGKKWNSEMEW